MKNMNFVDCENEHMQKYLTSDYLNEFTLKKRGLFDPKSVNRLIVENDSSRVDASYTLFSILCIEIWCQFFLDKNSDSIR